jgi:hypothetical protein
MAANCGSVIIFQRRLHGVISNTVRLLSTVERLPPLISRKPVTRLIFRKAPYPAFVCWRVPCRTARQSSPEPRTYFGQPVTPAHASPAGYCRTSYHTNIGEIAKGVHTNGRVDER